MWPCKTNYQGGGSVSHHFGELLTSLKKYRAIRGIAAIASRLSFPATAPPDPGTDFKALGSLTHHRFRHLLEGVLNGS